MAVQSSSERAWTAIKRFYENCKTKVKGKKGYPRFQRDNRSVEYKTSGWALHSTKRQITFTDKIGIGKLKLLGTWDVHTYPVKAIKRVRLVRRANGYYCQFCLDVESSDIQTATGQEIGLDVGLESFYTDSNGYHEKNPKFLRTAEKAVKHSQRRIYKKEKGSNNRRKARARYSRKHLRISRQRDEHAKRLARNLSKSNDLVAYENLSKLFGGSFPRKRCAQVRNLLKNHNLAKSISDTSWYLFRKWLEYFANKFGKLAIAVPPHYTSQKCSACGNTVKKSLSTRTHVCKCGCELHRDLNAALNILHLAKSSLGHKQSNARGVGSSTQVGENLLKQLPTTILESPCF